MAQPAASQLEAAAFTEINADAGREETADAESHTNGLIADLAWALPSRSRGNAPFKKLKQPVVLGYILAGFLASPKFVYLPSISNLENIDFSGQTSESWCLCSRSGWSSRSRSYCGREVLP